MSEKKENTSNYTGILLIVIVVIITFGAIYYLRSNQPNESNNGNNETPIAQGTEGTFLYNDELQLCTTDGKPNIYLFSTTWCPHCEWIGETYEDLVKQYVAEGKINAYHWELDIKDDTLTVQKEGVVPVEMEAIFKQYNPKGSIPTFVFGCKYWRVGNGYEAENNLQAEEDEFRKTIDMLVEESEIELTE